MRTRIRHIREIVLTSYWFIPGVMLTAATVLAFTMIYLDRVIFRHRITWLYSGGAEGARTTLATIAGSIITVAGVVFSITIAALTQASTQFGPRLLRNFMSDRGNQIVLGTFLATFIYCILILRTIHGEIYDNDRFVPEISLGVAVLLAIASVAVLVYFIHHVLMSLQAPEVVALVRADLDRVIDRLPADQKGAGVAARRDGSELPADFDATSAPIRATIERYVQAVVYEDLLTAAKEHDVVMRLEYRPGDYIICGCTLARVHPADRCDRELAQKINDAFICGNRATPEQDIEHAVRQLVEVAVRALSTGINDPFTAINCIDALGSALVRVAQRGLPGPLRHDEHGILRFVTPVTTFTGLTDAAFNQLRQYSNGAADVTIRLLEVIADCLTQVTADEQRQALYRHAEMIYHHAEQFIREPQDQQDLRTRWSAFLRAYEQTPMT